MSSKYVYVEDELSGRRRIRSYDARTVAQQYSNIAGILSGFAFTVIILVAQENGAASDAVSTLQNNLSAISFFVAFFGTTLSSFVFALVSGEEALTPRVNQMAFFGGLGFSLAMSLLFWSVASVLDSFLVDEAAIFVRQIFPIFILIHPVYVAASLLDNIFIFDLRKPNLKEYVLTIGPSLIPLITCVFLRLFSISFSPVDNVGLFRS
ncbi:MAG: hypothetical protein AAFV85_27375, partial [Cyanobacteria bacterium J06634_6]